jgi:lipopolysaccharide/colanic/teichoic acid biosynthesis glycosyltransferase
LIIVIDSSGSIVIRQERVGKNNTIFTLYKYRTMVKDAEQKGPQWSKKDDDRITKAGKLLRAVRFDELPQIYNILKGDMSFVGPRPERPEFVSELKGKIPHYGLRHFARPGLTGWAQVKQPYASNIQESAKKLEYDLYYIKNRSPVLDIKIILRTIMIILKRKGR